MGQRGEEFKSTVHACVGFEESRNHHVGAVAVYSAVGRVESLARECRALGIDSAGIAAFHALAESVERSAELLKGLAAEAIVGVAHTLESRTERERGHREGTCLCGGIAHIHILYALRRGVGAAGIEVDLQVLDRFKRQSQLQVLGLVGGGRCRHAVSHEQPTAILSFVDVAVAHQAKGKVQSWREDARIGVLGLAKGITDVRHEAGQCHGVLIAIRYADTAHHHGHASQHLSRLVPSFLIECRLSHH